MKALRALAVIVVALVLQAGLGRMFPSSHAYVDVLLAPVVIYGIAGGQRAGMFMGCFTGLLTDTWFHGGPFGLFGFQRTLLGWVLGGVSSRFDLNQPAGRFVVGVVVSVADHLGNLMLRGLLDADPAFPGLLALTVRAVTTGLLVWAGGAILEGGRGAEQARSVV